MKSSPGDCRPREKRVMRSHPDLLLLVVIFLTVSGCSDKGTEPEAGTYLLYQIPGCGNAGLSKASPFDSCFEYTFGGDLDVSWCLPANCCPDTQRFALSSTILYDEIIVAVRDTARQLCRCNCSYSIHASYSGLPFDRYTFLVQYGDSVFYRETVYRRR